jgi:Family of unknown function (DUF6452)
MKKIIVSLICFLFALSGCEKDDICDPNTQTTPQVVIDFYDFGSPQTLRNLIDLKVIAEGTTDTLILGSNRFETSDSRIKLPLRSNATTTKYKLIFNSNDRIATATDEITFNYSSRNEFINRACGFKSLYELNEETPFLINDQLGVRNGNWIRNYIISTRKIENEIEAHIRIFF